MIESIAAHSVDKQVDSTAALQQGDEDDEDYALKTSILPTETLSSLVSPSGSTFDYLYEFSETRKVLEEFFKCPAPTEEKESTESYPFQVNLFLCPFFLRY